MRQEIARGAAWMVLFRLLDRSVGVVSTAVLARLLLPADFGLVAMAMSVIAIIEMATAFNFEIALIQMHDPKREHFDTAWTMNAIIACGGAAAVMLAAAPASVFYGDSRLTAVMMCIGAAWMVSALESIGPVAFRREMNFAAEFRLMAAKRMTSFFVTLAGALILRSYWALVIGMATGRVAGVALSYLMHPYRPRPALAHARELFSFSGWMFINNALAVTMGRAPQFYVGRVFGPQLLGAYTVASEIAQLAQTELIAPINRAMFPGYARLVSDLPRFRKICVDAASAILLIALPVSVGVAVLAGPFVRLLLGAQWEAAVPIIQVLTVSATVTAVTSNNVSVYLALGRPSLVTATTLTRLVTMVVGMLVLGPRWGVIGIASAELVAALASLLVSMPTMFTTLHIRLRDYFGAMWRPLVASALMGWAIVAVLAPGFDIASPGRAGLDLLLGTLLGALVYPAALAALWLAAGRPDAVEVQIVLRALAELKSRVVAWRTA